MINRKSIESVGLVFGLMGILPIGIPNDLSIILCVVGLAFLLTGLVDAWVELIKDAWVKKHE